MSEITETEKEEALHRGKQYERSIDYVVDTVSVKDHRLGAAFYTAGSNSIYTYYLKETGYNTGKEGTLTHEQKHRDNQMQGLYNYPTSPEQAYKLYVHDEISAMMSDLIVKRQRYLETGDISVFDYSFFRFYKEAIEKGEINPYSNNQAEFDKEMRLIVNGTQQYWQKNWAEDDTYLRNSVITAMTDGDHCGKYAPYWDENYQKAMKVAYTIGGVDFTQYMNSDVEIPASGLSRMREAYSKRIEPYNPEGPSTYMIFDLKTGHAYFTAKNAEEYYAHVFSDDLNNQAFLRDLPAYNGDMSIEQYHAYLQHYLTVQEFQETVKRGNLEKSDLSKKYQECFDKVQEKYGNFIDVVADKAILDRNRRIKSGQVIPPIPSSEKGRDCYNNALSKLYEQPVFGQNKAFTIKSIAKYGANSMRPLPPYAKSVDDKANGKELSLWSKLKSKVKHWGVETKVRNLFNKQDEKIGFWKGVKNKVADWFKKDTEKPQSNEIILPSNTSPAKYLKWENKDGHRYSDVQYCKIPDLTKPFIKQPTQNQNTSKNDAMAKMKKDAVKTQSSNQENILNPNKSKESVVDKMKNDTINAKKAMTQNTKQKKISRVTSRGTNQTQMFEKRYSKIF